MKKRSFTNLPSLRWMVLPLVMAVLCCNWAYAQPNCQLNCNDLVRVGVNNNCEALITYDLMLEDPNNSNICLPNGPSAYTIIVMTDPDDPNSVLPNSPLITSADFECGRRFYVKVKHWSSNNACWGEVIVEDKQMPTVQCPPDVLLECTDDPSLVYGDPRSQSGTFDNCTSNSDLVCTFEDEVVSEGCLVDDATGEELCKVIERTWTCVDECGNANSCVQIIKVRRLTCDDIIGVPNAQLNCAAWPEANLDPNAMQQPIPPSVSGEPTYRKLDGSMGRIPVSPGSHDVCKISVTYMDKVLDLCGGGYKIIRTFTILDWCAEEVCDEVVQIIKVPDEDISISCPAPMTVGTNLGATACGWLGNLPAATVTEDCSDFTVTTTVTDADGNVVASLPSNGGGPVLLESAPCETTYTITYTAEDECGNVDDCSTTITIIDDDAPTPVCDEITQVTLDAVDGIAIIFAETFDDGSHDNCCAREDLTFEVRRMGTAAWGEFATFTCADCPGPVMVEMRVTDCCGNISESCMVEVLVDDKTPPIIVCPADQTIECEVISDANDPVQVRNYIESTQLPLVTATDNCEVDRIEITNIRTNLNDCGLGTIRVTYTAYDGPCDPVLTSSCTQTITIVDNTPVTVSFPPDYTAVCDNNDGNGFNGSLDPDDLPAPFNAPVITKDCELVAVNHFDETLPISDGACFKILRRWVVINWCIYDANGPQTPANGYFTHVQVVKVLDQTAPVVECPDDFTVCILDGCSATVDIPVPNATDCVPSDLLTYTVRGDFNSFSTPNVGIGNYSVVITVFDHCGNATECPVNIKVEDCKKPTPYCENGLVVELMPTTGMVEIWASDFNAGSFDNCPGELTFSFSSDVTETGRTFNCDNRGANTVQIWVTDAAGNQDFCETFVNIQDNMGACSGGGAIAPLVAGSIDTEMSEDVESVSVSVNGTSDINTTTTEAGSFNFNLPMGGDYSITPQKDMNPLNGVTTFDLVTLRKHVLGVQLLDSPYKMIAADINNSRSISTFDMVELRKLILQVNSDLPNNTSWRFVRADYNFPDPANPWVEQFPEVINFNNLDNDQTAADFIAIKIGDLNNSAQANTLLGNNERTTAGELAFNVADQKVVAGNEYTVEFTADLAEVEGYQFTLNYEGLELANINEGVAQLENFGTVYATEGAITTSWDGVAESNVAFSLTFRATTDANLSELLSVSSQYTTAEAYSNNDRLDVALTFNGTAATTEFELFQNTPNPFQGATTVSFNLPEAATATLTVFDLTGKVLTVVNGDYAAGYNDVELANLNASGVLYYTLETANYTATKKMILVK